MTGTKKCAVCEDPIEPMETPHIVQHADEPTFMHELCYWRATAGMLASQLSRIEAQIENGNAVVTTLINILETLLPLLEKAAISSMAADLSLTPERIDVLEKTVTRAKKLVAQFKAEEFASKHQQQTPHICKPGCKHK